MAEIVNEEGNWIRSNVIVVQTGDITDRGPDGLQMLEWIKSLEEQAPKYNSTLYTLIGNHEAMNIMGDWRYVSQSDVLSFGGPDKRKEMLSITGEWGAWLLTHQAVVNIDGNIFVHGGVSLKYATDAKHLSSNVHNALLGIGNLQVLGDEGPLWYRGYLLNDEVIACQEIEQTLKKMDGKRMIMGHTTQENGKIHSRCNGKIIGIDTGISSHYGGHNAAIEIVEDKIYALYPNKKILISTKGKTE
jgi:hypothetical protein